MRSVRLALPFVFFVHAGCVRGTVREVDTPTAVMDDEVAEPGEVAPEVREVVVASQEPSGEGVPVGSLPPEGDQATRRRLPPEPVFFHLGAGYGALGLVDLAPCRDQGLPRGYLRVHVTFQSSGRVARAAVEAPAAPPVEALTCIGEQLELAMVPAFGGGDVTLSKSFFVN